MLPDIGYLHPQIVHFVIGLLVIGVLFRIIALTGRMSFTGPAATTLILIGTVAAVLAAASGDAAHGPAERVPGARPAVEDHEDWGVRTRNIFIIVSILEVVAVLLASRTAHGGIAKGLRVASAVVGLAGIFALYETGEHGGELVYSYAGGVGTRSGKPVDVQNTLVAGLYHSAMAARTAGRPDEAARLIDELYRQRPQDAEIQLLRVESALRDRQDARGALDAIAGLPANLDTRLKTRAGMLQADAYVAVGQRDSARAVIAALLQVSPDNAQLKARADSLR